MNNLMQKLMLGGSAVAMVATSSLVASSAYAQGSSAAGASGTAIETVVVSGSNITIQGYQAPTPVQVIGAAQIARDAETDVGDVIRQLPSVGASASPNNGVGSNDSSQGDSGLDTINLRNLGANRTLTLFDGQRVVSSNLLGGGVDLSTIPTSVIQRIDVVTGGASAAYGSDAVAGVVNLIINKTFTGLKGDIQGGDTTTFVHRQAKAELTWGEDFDGGRGHLILSGNYTTSPDTVFGAQEPYNVGAATILNPAATSTNGLPIYIHVYNTGSTSNNVGGLITGNTAAAAGSGGTVAANALKGVTFGPGGALEQFQYGTVYGGTCYNGAQIGLAAGACSNNQFNNGYGIVAVPYHQGTFFAYGSYEVTSDIKASVQINYGTNSEENTATLATSSAAVYADNAYLPQAIASQFGTLTYPNGKTNAPAQSITLASNNLNDTGFPNTLKPSQMSYDNLCSSVGQPCDTDNRAMGRAVFTLDGTINDDWSWTAYVQHSEVRERQILRNDPLKSNLTFAEDSVITTAANVGTSGLPIGSIQCRGALQGNPAAAGCVPLDQFGPGAATNAAWEYINPGETPGGRTNQELIIMNQDVLSGSVQGVLPWQLPAGRIAVASGASYRHEQGGVIAAGSDPGGLTTAWQAGNFVPYQGQYYVYEGFAEVDAPLLKDQFVQNLNLNLAGRITDYSTSGLVETWKIGLTSQINDDVKVRGTVSYDIRAPLVSDLFSPGTPASQQCSYFVGGTSYSCYQLQAGNRNLQPEKANTISGGVVLTPHWVDGLTLSADWYYINVHSAITSVGYQTEISRCVATADPVYCNALSNYQTVAGQPGPVPLSIFAGELNAAEQYTSGLDYSANYRLDLPEYFGGTLDLAAVGGIISQYNNSLLGVDYDQAGAAGGYASSGIPKWKLNLSATYNDGPWSGTLQGRLLGGMVTTNGLSACSAGCSTLALASVSATGVLTAGSLNNGNQVDRNNINPVGYLDVRGSYRMSDNFVLYGAIDNITNVPPPVGGSATTYDDLGRDIRLGVRMTY